MFLKQCSIHGSRANYIWEKRTNKVQVHAKHFPNNHKLRKIFNRNTVKISYSCMNNTKQIIDNHNKRILTASIQIDNTATAAAAAAAAASIDNNKTCNCRQKNTCPLDGNCLQSSVIYHRHT